MASTIKTPKAIYVGAEQVYDHIVNFKPEWEFAPVVPTVNDLWKGLESGAIDSNTQAVLVLDVLFDSTGADTEFEQMVVSLAPYSFLGIINYTPEKNDEMRQRIEAQAYSLGVNDIKYYLIDPKRFAPSLDAAVDRFISESDQQDNVAILSGRPVSDGQDEPEKALNESAEDAMRAAIETQRNANSEYLGQIVAVTSSKGGSGKSSVAIMLATYLAHASVNSAREGLETKPLKVLILDLDVRDGQLGFFTNHSKPTVFGLHSSGITSENIQKTIIENSRLKCDLMLAPKQPRRADDIPPEFFVELVQELIKIYDYVILDTSINYLDPLLEKVAYPMANHIVFVSDIVINSVFSMTRWISEVTKPKDQMGMGIPRSKIGIVMNKALDGVSMPGDKIYKSTLGIPVITAIPSAPKLMAVAANTQQMDVLLEHPDIKAAIRRLAKAVVGKRYNLSENLSK